MLCWIFQRCRKAHAWRRHSGLAIASHCTGFRSAARTSAPARLGGARSSMRTFRPAAPGSTSQTSRQGTPAGRITMPEAIVPSDRRRPGPHETGQLIEQYRRASCGPAPPRRRRRRLTAGAAPRPRGLRGPPHRVADPLRHRADARHEPVNAAARLLLCRQEGGPGPQLADPQPVPAQLAHRGRLQRPGAGDSAPGPASALGQRVRLRDQPPARADAGPADTFPGAMPRTSR